MKRASLILAVLALILSGVGSAGAAIQIVVVSPQQQPAPDTLPSASSQYSFNQASGPFANDFDDLYRNETSYNYTGQLSDGTKITSYNANSLGLPDNSFFSPTQNSSGVFVGFLGNDKYGQHSDAISAPTQVALIVNANDSTIQYGYLEADYSYTTGEDTTFTIVDTSALKFDPMFQGSGFPLLPALPEVAVPEPATLTMLGIGIAGLAGYGWRRRKQQVANA